MTFKVINPALGEVVNRFDVKEIPIPERIDAAERAFAEWRQTKMAERKSRLSKTADILKRDRDDYAKLMAVEMGKPIQDGRAEIEKCVWLCRHVAETAADMLAPEMVKTDARKSFITFPPLGVVLGVMPWNYPFWQVFRFAAPSLMAGNAVLLKHASNVPGCSMAIEKIMHDAGFPTSLFQSLLIPGEQVSAVIEHPAVKGVALTGGKSAGQAVASAAAKKIIKSVLELGGSDPYLILEDADLDLAVEACVAGRLLNSGQSCIAAKRFIVVSEIQEEFEQRLVGKMKSVQMGDPMDKDTEIGPLARSDLRKKLHRQVHASMEKGARCLLGGNIPDGKGFFYPPTVLTSVRPGMPAFDEETFGPVAAVVSAADEEDAVHLANHSDFGLGAAVFTRDLKRGEFIAAERLEAGNCFVNAFVKSDPRLPFGGIKESGYGRELSAHGIKSFVNIKTVYVA